MTYGFYFLSFGFLVLCADVHIIIYYPKNNFHITSIFISSRFKPLNFLKHTAAIKYQPLHPSTKHCMIAGYVKFIRLMVVRYMTAGCEIWFWPFYAHRRPSDPLGLAAEWFGQIQPRNKSRYLSTLAALALCIHLVSSFRLNTKSIYWIIFLSSKFSAKIIPVPGKSTPAP